MEKILGKKFGDLNKPLLVAVRSGARDSMPGMMDTILNLGLNDQTVLALVKVSKNERFAWDCYRRFIPMYGGLGEHTPVHHSLTKIVCRLLLVKKKKGNIKFARAEFSRLEHRR